MKKILSFLTVLLFSSSALAEDITNPFYMPMKNKMLSETSVSYTKDKYKYSGMTDTVEQTVLNEDFSFGVSDRFSLTGSLGNRFEASGEKTNVYWGIGGTYAFYFENNPEALLQIGASYSQEGGHRDLEAFVRAGYAADAVILPYAEFRFLQPINYGKDVNEPVFGVRVAGYSMIKEIVGVRAGVDFVYAHEAPRQQSYDVFGEIEYMVSEKIAVGVEGSYLFHDTGADTSGFSVGANVKIAF